MNYKHIGWNIGIISAAKSALFGSLSYVSRSGAAKYVSKSWEGSTNQRDKKVNTRFALENNEKLVMTSTVYICILIMFRLKSFIMPWHASFGVLNLVTFCSRKAKSPKIEKTWPKSAIFTANVKLRESSMKTFQSLS